MNFRLTVRDGFPGAGGIGSASTRLTLAPLAGPFLVTSQAAPATLRAGTVQTVTWDVAGTAAAPVNTSEVKISLLSGEVLAAATPNDGSAEVTVPNIADQHARIKVEAVGNVFFDVSDADLVIQAAPDVVVTDKTVQYSDAVRGSVVEAADADSAGSALTATATGLPAGLSLADGTTSEHSRTWTLAGNVTAAPGVYTGSVTVTDGDGEAITKPLIVTVTPEDAVVTYLGDTLSSGKVLLRARLKDADDGAPGDIGKATITFREGSRTLCTGSLSCTVTLPNGTYAITVEAGGYYTGSAQATVRVAKATRKVNAIGFLSHLSTIFAIDNKYAEIVYGKDGRAYRISADDVESIGFSTDGKRAEVRFKADLWDHTKILRPVRVGRNLTLQVSLSETGRGSIAFSLWDEDTLVHDQPERTLAGGFVTIR
jgi:Putative Ig domain